LYRPRAAAVVVALVAAAMLVALNASGYARVSESEGVHWQNGWPFAVVWRRVYTIGGGDFGLPWATRPVGDLGDGQFSARALLGNLIVGAAATALLLAAAERRIRRKGRLAQFSLREMLALIAVAGIIAGYEMSVHRREREAIVQLAGRHCRFDVDEGLPDWLRPGPLRGRLFPFDRVTRGRSLRAPLQG
jgi:hypothetical protein